MFSNLEFQNPLDASYQSRMNVSLATSHQFSQSHVLFGKFLHWLGVCIFLFSLYQSFISIPNTFSDDKEIYQLRTSDKIVITASLIMVFISYMMGCWLMFYSWSIENDLEKIKKVKLKFILIGLLYIGLETMIQIILIAELELGMFWQVYVYYILKFVFDILGIDLIVISILYMIFWHKWDKTGESAQIKRWMLWYSLILGLISLNWCFPVLHVLFCKNIDGEFEPNERIPLFVATLIFIVIFMSCSLLTVFGASARTQLRFGTFGMIINGILMIVDIQYPSFSDESEVRIRDLTKNVLGSIFSFLLFLSGIYPYFMNMVSSKYIPRDDFDYDD